MGDNSIRERLTPQDYQSYVFLPLIILVAATCLHFAPSKDMLTIINENMMKTKALSILVARIMKAMEISAIKTTMEILRFLFMHFASIGLLGSAIGPIEPMMTPELMIMPIITLTERFRVMNGSITENARKIPIDEMKHSPKLGACQPPVNMLKAQ